MARAKAAVMFVLDELDPIDRLIVLQSEIRDAMEQRREAELREAEG
jgi:hypothetical protein